MNIQVDKNYYLKEKYATLERFVSYFFQVKFLRQFTDKKILIIGVGDGLVPYYLSKILNLSIKTLDIDPELNPSIVGDVKFIPFKDNEFDVVAVYEVLEHLPFKDFEKSLSELARVSKDKVIISLPYRHTGFDFVFRFPFIQTLFKRKFFRIYFFIPIRFPGFKESGQHYWEIDNGKTKIKTVRQKISKYFHILEDERPPLDAYRHFFVLYKKTNK